MTTRLHYKRSKTTSCDLKLEQALRQKRWLKIIALIQSGLIVLILFTLYFNQIRQSTLLVTKEAGVACTPPAGWPKSIPIIAGAMSTEPTERFSEAAQTVSFTTVASPEAVISKYQETFVQNGGTVEARLRTDSREILVFKTNDGVRAALYAGAVDGVTEVTINVEPLPAKTVDE